MRGEVDRPEQRAQHRVEDRKRGVHGTDLAVPDRVAAFRRTAPAVPSLREALTAALHQRVAQRTGTLLSGISASTASMRQRSWCNPRPGVGRWASVPRARRSRPQRTWTPTSDERLRRLRARVAP
jgi:hypothetical protein